MDEILQKTLLFDFYGELLTEHQQSIYEDVVFNDMSLSEAASEYGISRQGIHDLIRRCDRTLREYEEKLGLIAQFEEMRSLTGRMKELLSSGDSDAGDLRASLLSLVGELEKKL